MSSPNRRRCNQERVAKFLEQRRQELERERRQETQRAQRAELEGGSAQRAQRAQRVQRAERTERAERAERAERRRVDRELEGGCSSRSERRRFGEELEGGYPRKPVPPTQNQVDARAKWSKLIREARDNIFEKGTQGTDFVTDSEGKKHLKVKSTGSLFKLAAALGRKQGALKPGKPKPELTHEEKVTKKLENKKLHTFPTRDEVIRKFLEEYRGNAKRTKRDGTEVPKFNPTQKSPDFTSATALKRRVKEGYTMSNEDYTNALESGKIIKLCSRPGLTKNEAIAQKCEDSWKLNKPGALNNYRVQNLDVRPPNTPPLSKKEFVATMTNNPLYEDAVKRQLIHKTPRKKLSGTEKDRWESKHGDLLAFRKKVKELMASNPKLSRSEAMKQAKTAWVAEHRFPGQTDEEYKDRKKLMGSLARGKYAAEVPPPTLSGSRSDYMAQLSNLKDERKEQVKAARRALAEEKWAEDGVWRQKHPKKTTQSGGADFSDTSSEEFDGLNAEDFSDTSSEEEF